MRPGRAATRDLARGSNETTKKKKEERDEQTRVVLRCVALLASFRRRHSHYYLIAALSLFCSPSPRRVTGGGVLFWVLVVVGSRCGHSLATRTPQLTVPAFLCFSLSLTFSLDTTAGYK